MECDVRQGLTLDQRLRPGPRVLTTQALVLGGYSTLLPTLGLLAQTVIVVCVSILGAHRLVGPITGDTITGAAGTATAGQTHGTKLASLRALVCGDPTRSEREHQPHTSSSRNPWIHR